MAVTRIKAYHTESSMHNGLNYSADPDKSTLRNKPFSQAVTEGAMAKAPDKTQEDNLPPFDHPRSDQMFESIRLSRVFSYTVNPDKTHINKDGHVDILVSGHHCNPDLAETDFKRCRGLYYMNGHRDRTTYAKAKRPMRAALDETGRPRYDDNGKMIYNEKAPIYKDPTTGRWSIRSIRRKRKHVQPICG